MESGPFHVVELQVGTQTFDDDALDQALGSPTSFGVELATRENRTGWGWGGGLVFSTDSAEASGGGVSAEFDLTLIETLIGGRYTYALGDSPVSVYGGGGLDLLLALFDGSLSGSGGSLDSSDAEYSVGGYLQAGASVQLGSSVSLGVGVRKTLATEAFDIELDYLQIFASLGFSI